LLNRATFVSFALYALVGTSTARAAESEAAIPPAVTQQLPANTASVLLLRTDATWSALTQFSGIPETLDNPGFLPLVPLVGENYRQEIQPWVGDWAALATIPLSSTPSEVPVSGIVMIPVTDEAALDTYLDRLQESRDSPSETQLHNGVEILFLPEENRPEFPTFEPNPEAEPSFGQTLEKGWKQDGFASLLKGYAGVRERLAQTAKPPVATPPPMPEPSVSPPEPLPPVLPYKPSLAVVRLPGYVVFSTSIEDVKGFLDIPNTTRSLADTPEFQNLVSRPEFDRSLFAMYGNAKQAAQLVSDFQTSFPMPPNVAIPDTQTLADIAQTYAQTYTTIEGLAWIADTGIRLQVRAHYREPQPELASRWSNPNRLVQRLPGTTYFAANGQNLAQGVRFVLDIYSKIPLFAQPIEQFRQSVQENLGLDFDREVIGWMDGEFAFFAFPTNRGLYPNLFPNFRIGVGVTIETSDRTAAERFLTALDNYIEQVAEGFVFIDTLDIGGQPFVSWDAPLSPDGSWNSQMAHGWIDDNTLLVTTGSGPAEQLYPSPYTILPDSYNFQTAIAPFPETNAGYIYYNVSSLVAFVNNLSDPPLTSFAPPEAQPFIDAIMSVRSLSLAFSFTEDREQADVHLVLSPKR